MTRRVESSGMSSDTPATSTRETIETDRTGYVGRITLSRPDAMNTFSTQLAQELDDALGELDEDPNVRAIIVDGAGDVFSAGIDISEHADHESKDAYREWVARMEEPFHTVVEMRTPVVAAVHGHAAANGLGLVAACDLAVAAEGTKFGATAPKVGLFCMGPAVPLMSSITRKRYNELLLTGELIDAETARDWGLINRVAPEGEHVDRALEFVEPMVEKSPVGIQMGKEAVTTMAELPYHEAIEYSNEQFAELCRTDDAREGIRAFLDGEPLGAEEWPGE
ncbi:MAG: enoyl-CoA hydratase/carnithine racemase [Natronomonas sp.]|jgi:enoyl-CoA hydratase/carnithine racemase